MKNFTRRFHLIALLISPTLACGPDDLAGKDSEVTVKITGTVTESWTTTETRATKLGDNTVLTATGPNGHDISIVLHGVESEGDVEVKAELSTPPYMTVSRRDRSSKIMTHGGVSATQASVKFNPLRVTLRAVRMLPPDSLNPDEEIFLDVDSEWPETL